MLTSDFHIHPHRQACSGIYTCMHTHKINASSKKAGCTLGLSPCLLVTTGHGFLSTPRSSSSTWDLPPLQADPGALWFRMLQCDDALKFFYHRVPSQVGHFQPEAHITHQMWTLWVPPKNAPSSFSQHSLKPGGLNIRTLRAGQAATITQCTARQTNGRAQQQSAEVSASGEPHSSVRGQQAPTLHGSRWRRAALHKATSHRAPQSCFWNKERPRKRRNYKQVE